MLVIGYSAKEHLHKSIPVIASTAKHSIFACQSITYGSPRRYAPRDDGLMQPFPNCMEFILTARAHFFPVSAHARTDLSILLHLFIFALDQMVLLGQSCRAARLPCLAVPASADRFAEVKLRHTLRVEVFVSVWIMMLAKRS